MLTRQDRDPLSPTYGCFDREYWHHRTVDFPSGSAARCVWPLALAWALPVPGNPYRGSAAVKQWVGAGIRYAARSAHADGSCDERFPLEKSPEATACSLLACIEAYSLLGLNDQEMLESFTRRADWLAAGRRKGRPAVEIAFVALALEKAGSLLDTERWKESGERFLRRLLRLQDAEGWFPENHGADPASHTFTVGLLAQLYQVAPSHELRVALTRGVQFAADFVHPDGSFGGEYGSLGSACFFPHGFEIAGEWLPEAPAVNDQFLAGVEAGMVPDFSDPALLAWRCWSHLLAWQQWKRGRPPAAPRREGRQYYKHAGLLIDRRDGCELYVALNKGGTFKFWRDGRLVISDTQLGVQVRQGARFATAIASFVGKYDIHLDGHAIEVRGRLAFVESRRMSVARLVLGRMLMAAFGCVACGLVRRFCERDPVKKSAAPFRFRRSLEWSNGRLRVTDELEPRRGWHIVHAVGLGCLQASCGVDASRVFHASELRLSEDFTGQTHQLEPAAPLRIEREF